MGQSGDDFERQYDYRPTWTGIVLCGAFFGCCLAVLTYLAWSNDEEVKINFVRLSPFAGRVFYALLATASGAFVVGTVLFVYVRLTSVQRIALNSTGVLLPIGTWYRCDEAFVPFADIQAVKSLEAHGQEFVYIYANGLRYTIFGAWLKRSDFDDLKWRLRSRLDPKILLKMAT